MATAYWYCPATRDAAIEEFQKSLTYETEPRPAHYSIWVFVEWQGKMDITRAVATCRISLPTRIRTRRLKTQSRNVISPGRNKHSGVKPGTTAKPLQ